MTRKLGLDLGVIVMISLGTILAVTTPILQSAYGYIIRQPDAL
jgi:hypothetical protein